MTYANNTSRDAEGIEPHGGQDATIPRLGFHRERQDLLLHSWLGTGAGTIAFASPGLPLPARPR